ncbi:MAG: peptidoglycan DD-metalloendopeptidase family protein [Anaerolineales bacterium]|nr:peptidoglycan DD-metalloendopeptidase family protein [Anaerolineales bacterium]
MPSEGELSQIEIEESDQIDQPPSVFRRMITNANAIRASLLLLVLVILSATIWAFQSGAVILPATAREEEEEIASINNLVMEAMGVVSLEQLSSFASDVEEGESVVFRRVDVHTIIPSRPRIDVIKYEVKEGDTLFGISEKYNLKPETILWGNWYTLGGDPHTLRPGQELNILPVNGVLHRWSAGEGLNGVASFYGVTADDIINWPGNNLNLDIDRAAPAIEEGTALVVPGGRREPPSWQMIRITRSNPAVASVLGPGYCGSVSTGLVGDGVFGWPTSSTSVSGYSYIPGVHEAIDIGGSTGSGIFASDDGVVVYAGWNDWGYGFVVVLDHGNGWQTLYAHLSQINVGCGQSTSQGQLIGNMGCTGNCTGSHLHFEMRHDAWGRVNPINFLP